MGIILMIITISTINNVWSGSIGLHSGSWDGWEGGGWKIEIGRGVYSKSFGFGLGLGFSRPSFSNEGKSFSFNDLYLSLNPHLRISSGVSFKIGLLLDANAIFTSFRSPFLCLPGFGLNAGLSYPLNKKIIGLDFQYKKIYGFKNFNLFTFALTLEEIPKPKSKPQLAKKEVRKPVSTGKRMPKYPPDLVISDIRFTEPSGNNALDAGEVGEVSFVITNRGKGDATGVGVKVLTLQGGKGIRFGKDIKIGNLEPNKSKRVRVRITGTRYTVDGITKLRIETQEAFGFDADPFTISFETQRLVMPELIIADVGIDDDKEGESYGDNDGIIERGELVEVSVGIQNVGEGDARNTQVVVNIPYEGKNLFYTSERKDFVLGNISSGDYKVFKFCFMTNKRFSESKVPVYFDIKSATRDYVKRDSISLNVGVPSQYTKEIRIARKEIPRKRVSRKVELSVDVDDVPQIASREDPNKIAVIIGVEEYKYAPPADYANRDATVFYEYARKVLGVPERNIYIRTNEDATKGEFDKIFGRDGWLARRIEKGKSVVYVYFSGHGAPDIRTKKPYIIPYDIDPNYASSAFSLEELYSSLSSLSAKSAYIFIDACFSGVARGEEMLLASAKAFTVVPLPKIPEGVCIFTASEGSQIASAYKEKKHGLFTYFLLKGLKGESDEDRDGRLTVGELYRYIRENVEREARYMDREQTPTFMGDMRNVIIERL